MVFLLMEQVYMAMMAPQVMGLQAIVIPAMVLRAPQVKALAEYMVMIITRGLAFMVAAALEQAYMGTARVLQLPADMQVSFLLPITAAFLYPVVRAGLPVILPGMCT